MHHTEDETRYDKLRPAVFIEMQLPALKRSDAIVKPTSQATDHESVYQKTRAINKHEREISHYSFTWPL